MKAFDIQGDVVTFTPEFLAVPEVKAIWDRDKTKNKTKAIKELSFIVFYSDERLHNPYTSYSIELREEILRADFLDGSTKPLDEKILAGIRKLKQLLETTSMRLLLSAQVAADKLAGWFKKVNFDLVKEDGKPVYSASELSRNLKDVGNIIKSLKELENQVRKEQEDDNKARGGSEIGMFELPTKRDY